MKLELVMLTIAIGFITERQVEALVECYEQENLTGLQVQLGSSSDITSHFPNGPGACKVPADSTVIFYENINHDGVVTAIHTVKEEVVRSKPRVIRSILELGNQHQNGIYLFTLKNFRGGSFEYFSGKVDNVIGDKKFQSVIVIGETLDWTIARSCNSQGRCLSCLKRAKAGHGASFINSIDSTGMGKILSVSPGDCKGKIYAGLSRFPGKGTTVKHIPGKMTHISEKVFLVECTIDCEIFSIKTFNGNGGIMLEAETDDGAFCEESDHQSSNVECKGPYRIGRKSFYVKLRPFRFEVKDVSLSVTLKNSVPRITEAVIPSVAIRKDKSGKSYVEVKTGYREIKGINYQHIKVDCDGACTGIGFSSSGGSGDVKLRGSEKEPAFVNKNGCINNCICESNGPGNADVCKLQNGVDKFDLTSEFFWIFLEPNQPFRNVIAKVTGDNIKGVFEFRNIASQTVTLPDGSFVLALPPLKKGTYRHMEVYAYVRALNDIRLELLGDGKDDIEIRAGPTTRTDSNGVCNKCYCQGQCKKPFSPNKYALYLTFTALKKDIDDIVYVKMSGKNIDQLLPSFGITRSYI